ncbi:MAG TPA: aldo/keto reductase [Gemmatimonadaceae bacterium]|jgi:aryl-alcohol dehydrogenase-like predicted oxidoreductase|nr:aldo/keto reductase [Gemmatimonadaceae bacterium]
MATDRSVNRREVVKLGLGAGALMSVRRLSALLSEVAASQRGALIERAIPSTGEKLPVVGMGTAIKYEDPTPEQLVELRSVLNRFPELGGKVLDTAPSYGKAEIVVGDALAALGNRDRYFLATKVGRPAADRVSATAMIESSFKRLRTDRLDLLQIWNVAAPDVLVPVLHELKDARRIRYTGITTSFKNSYAALEEAMKKYKLDFVQVDLAVDNRSAQDRILPLAADLGMGALVNLPFGRTRVLPKVVGKPVPDWATEFDAATWPQILLKYIVSNPAVTCVIPGTDTVAYAEDNNAAARGRLPNAEMRKRIEKYFDEIA